jgi:hypothetical protein
MKKPFQIVLWQQSIVLFFLMCTTTLVAQTANFQYSAKGLLENVYDHTGSRYQLQDITIKSNNGTQRNRFIACNETSYFRLHFESGSGFENQSNPIENNRRDVLCRVLADVSSFINSPLNATGNKIDIWVKNYKKSPIEKNGKKAIFSSFYNIPTHENKGGIVDGEIWKTIHTGVDSYANVGNVLSPNSCNTNVQGLFYHGILAVNFLDYKYNANIAAMPNNSEFDLYSVLLTEVAHALGFQSLINQDGNSVIGNGLNYFTRYDTFLKDKKTNLPLIINKNNCTKFYDNFFNTSLPLSVLRPNCSLPNNTTLEFSNSTNCESAVLYAGNSFTIPVYTPFCFEPTLSLSHLADECFEDRTTGQTYANNTYFAMSAGLIPGTTKRKFTSEEFSFLCDLGYNLNKTFGLQSTTEGYAEYFDINCKGINVAGVNDGLNANGTFTFKAVVGKDFKIMGSQLLNNDRNATGFQCLEDLTGSSTLTLVSGSTNSEIIFNSSLAGIHLLRYIPTNGPENGNITYVYVYVSPQNGIQSTCTPVATNNCDLVLNGDFEQYSSLPIALTQIDKACGWDDPYVQSSRPDYLNVDASNPQVQIPTNFFGYQDVAIPGTKGYATIYGFSATSEKIKTKLKTPLAPNTNYQLSFQVSKTEGFASASIKWQAYLDDDITLFNTTIPFPIANPALFFTNPTYSTSTDSWETITFNFTTGAVATAQYLYLGFFDGMPLDFPQQFAYYIDNIQLVAVGTAAFNLPAIIGCPNTVLPNLASYLSNVPVNGVFSGTGVVNNNGIYSINTNGIVNGTYPITYSYNSAGCSATITKNIKIVTAPIAPKFTLPSFVCSGSTVSALPTTSLEGVVGTWNPVNLSNVATTAYTFTPNLLLSPCSLATTITIPVLLPSTLVANNDALSFNYVSTGYNTLSVLNNDTNNGVAMNQSTPFVTVLWQGTPPTFVTGGIVTNVDGTFTVLPNTSFGTYTYQYRVQRGCSALSNVASVTFTIIPLPITCPSKFTIRYCSNNLTEPTPTAQGLFVPNAWGDAIGILVNGMPATPANTIMTPITVLPAGISLNFNGTFTVQAGTPYSTYPFFVKFCTTANPSICTNPVRIDITNLPPIDDSNINFNLNIFGISTSTNTFVNILNAQRFCNGNLLLPADAIITFLSSSNPTITINPNGQIQPAAGNITQGTHSLSYKVCLASNPALCITKTIQVVVF